MRIDRAFTGAELFRWLLDGLGGRWGRFRLRKSTEIEFNLNVAQGPLIGPHTSSPEVRHEGPERIELLQLAFLSQWMNISRHHARTARMTQATK